MNILNRVISKTNYLKNKKLIEAIPKNFGLNFVSNKTFFIKNDSKANYKNEIINNLSLNSFNKFSKYNMSTSNIPNIIITTNLIVNFLLN